MQKTIRVVQTTGGKKCAIYKKAFPSVIYQDAAKSYFRKIANFIHFIWIDTVELTCTFLLLS
jgi:hypothetical protein